MNIYAAALAIPVLLTLASPSWARRQGQDSSQLSADELERRLTEHPEEEAYAYGLRKRAKQGDEKARPALKRLFESNNKPTTKRAIALALVRLGEKDDKYWDEIARPAKERVESDMPTILAFDSNGKSIRGKFSEDFLAWCKKRNVQPESMTMDALYRSQEDIRFLALTRDSRAIPLLMKGLESPNHMVVLKSAEGLARFQHGPAVEKIVAACERLPAESAAAVAEFLLYFKDKKAQMAADKHIPSAALERKRARAEKDGFSKIYGGADD
jgi:HEAT repeat protein